jgi:uncharacterized protein involved in exopolysaccharide biosynthesis
VNEREHERTLKDHLATARRRWRTAAAGFGIAFGIGCVIALGLPPVYRSTATILIEQQEIPQDLVRSTISSYADQRIQLIKQRVMRTDNLLRIIRENNLYADDFDRLPREAVIERMRNDIHVDTISADVVDPRSGRPTAATIAFTVAYDNRAPPLAARVANELTSLYLQENSQTRKQQAAEATTFLTSEAGRLSQEIAGLEGRLADFKEKNIERLPELAQLNQQFLTRTDDEIADAQRERGMIEERMTYLKTQLSLLDPNRDFKSSEGDVVLSPTERLKALESTLSSMRGVYLPDHPDVVRAEKQIASLRAQLGVGSGETTDLEQEVKDLKAKRDALLEHYEPEHPDVVRLDHQIEAAQEKLQAGQDSPPPSSDATSADNPAYVQLQAQVKSDEVQLQSLAKKEKDLRAKRADFEDRLLKTPAVERDFQALTRDLLAARSQYQEVSAKQMEAAVAQNLEMDSKSEHFSLIDPPLLPQRPIAPNRMLIVFLAAILAIGAAFGMVVLREALDSSVHDAAQLQRLIGLPPLGIVPTKLTPEDQRRLARRRIWTAAATVGGVIVVVAVTHFFVTPIDALFAGALRRFGV